MKAIEILYNKIDELNACIKIEKDLSNKYKYAYEIKMVIEAIDVLCKIRYDTVCPDKEEYI